MTLIKCPVCGETQIDTDSNEYKRYEDVIKRADEDYATLLLENDRLRNKCAELENKRHEDAIERAKEYVSLEREHKSFTKDYATLLLENDGLRDKCAKLENDNEDLLVTMHKKLSVGYNEKSESGNVGSIKKKSIIRENKNKEFIDSYKSVLAQYSEKLDKLLNEKQELTVTNENLENQIDYVTSVKQQMSKLYFDLNGQVNHIKSEAHERVNAIKSEAQKKIDALMERMKKVNDDVDKINSQLAEKGLRIAKKKNGHGFVLKERKKDLYKSRRCNSVQNNLTLMTKRIAKEVKNQH